MVDVAVTTFVAGTERLWLKLNESSEVGNSKLAAGLFDCEGLAVADIIMPGVPDEEELIVKTKVDTVLVSEREGVADPLLVPDALKTGEGA